MNTGLMALMVILSTVVSIGAGIGFCKELYSVGFGLIALNFFIVCFGILMPFNYHYRGHRYYRARF